MENEKELLKELEEPIELIDDDGNVNEFLYIGMTEYDGKNYAFFQPCESVEGAEPDDVVLFEIDFKEKTLIPLEDEDLMDKIFEKFENEYYGEYASEEDEILS